MTSEVPRRSVLRTVGGLSGIGVLGAGTAAADDPSRYIVGTASRAAERAARSRAESVHRELDFGSIGRAVVGEFGSKALDALRRRADVRYVEPDGAVQALGQSLPWGIDRVDADVAHANGETGNGADIAIIDTGIDSDHPDLQANLGEGYAVEACSGSNCNYAWDDDNDHGTHCAGIADGVNNSEGVVGVSTEATLHAVKVLDANGSGTFSGVAEGVTWVADQGYDVGSMSLGASSGSQTIKDACQYAYDKGVLLVGAAGNDGPCSDCVGYPAAYSTVVAVSATHDSGDLAVYSSTGPEVELAAPGSEIYSSVIGGYDTFSGTSMACPHVSGTGAQLMANGYSNTEARSRLQNTAEDVSLSSNEQGYGLVDTAAALGYDSTTLVEVSTDNATDVGDTSATLNGSLTDLGGADSVDVRFEIYNTATEMWSVTDYQTLTSTGTFSATVSSLDTNTEYKFRSDAEASDGDTDEGALVAFTTGTSDTSVAVSTNSVSSVGETSATLNGTLNDLGGASSADVSFEYRESGTSTWSSTSTQTLSSTGSFSQDVSGLSSGVDYEYRAVASASDGDTDTGNTVTFTTNTSDTSVAVATDSETSVGETTAALHGDLTDLGGASSADCYFEWGESGGSLSNTTSAQTLSSTGTYDQTVSGLSSGTEYEFRAVADASDGDIDSGTTLTFTTDSGSTVPSVDSYAVTEAGSPNPHAEITADWAVSDADSDLDTVLVEVIDSSGSVVDSSRTNVSRGSATGTDKFKIKHAGSATYDVRLTVTDAGGNSAIKTKTVSS